MIRFLAKVPDFKIALRNLTKILDKDRTKNN